MKKIFTLVALFVAVCGGRGFAQDSARISPVLSSYYDLKNALVKGDAHAAALDAAVLAKAVQGPAGEALPAASRNALIKNATSVSAKEDLEAQRTHFAALSAALAEVAKAVKLSGAPVYEEYCPMKKAYWLSADKAIQNPYYGSAMLTCGKVVADF